MCPGRLALRRNTSRVRSATTSQGARHTAGSRFPCTAFPGTRSRVIAPDDAWLSPFYGRESGSIAVHAYYREEHDFFFSIVEPILRRHGGRPHWGKLHSLKARDLAALYPRWKEAGEVRRALDPEGRMLNDYLKGIFLDD